jgi:hypothetical protein
LQPFFKPASYLSAISPSEQEQTGWRSGWWLANLPVNSPNLSFWLSSA